jgi:hypothetical protein
MKLPHYQGAFYDDFFLSFDNDSVSVSRNRGNTWSQSALPARQSPLQGVPLHAGNLIVRSGDTISIATDSSFYVSSDRGSTWRLAIDGLDSNVCALASDYNGHIYARAGYHSLVVFDCAAARWHRITSDLDFIISNLAWSPKGLLLGTYGSPVYRISPDALQLSVAQTTRVDSNALFAYPNPADDRVLLKQDAALRGTARLVNESGRVVLEQPYDSAHSLDVSTIPDGSYICTLSTGGVVKSAALVVHHIH